MNYPGWLAIAAVLLCSWHRLSAAAEPPAPKVVIYPAPAGEKASDDYKVEINGQSVFVYTANTLHGGPASFAYFDFAGKVNVAVTPSRKANKAVIRPLSCGLTPIIAENTISFALSQPRNLSLELNDGFERPLLLFANPLETDAPNPNDPNVLYFGPGVHEITTTKIGSGKTVYLAGGAVVRGKIAAGEKPVQERNWAGNKVYDNLLCIGNAKNVQIRGRGILDMSTLPWHSKCPICITNSTDVLVEGIIIKDSPCWCMPMFNCTRGTYRNVKEVCHRENSDGINIVNSQEILVENCFLRNNDDEICVKTTAPPPAPEGKNITVRNCVVWNDRAYAIGITYETRNAISDVLFKDCDIIHDHGIGSLTIHMSDGATVSGVRFEDIRIEDTRNRLVRFWIGTDMWGHDKTGGRIRGVTLKNVSVVDGPFAPSELTGFNATHLVEDVTFENLRNHGKLIGSLAAGRISANPHTKNIRFVTDTTPPAEAPKITVAKAMAGDPQIALAWTGVDDPESGIACYNIYRDERKAGEAKGTSYTDAGLEEETAYSYRVAAVNGSEQEGPKSAPVQAKTLADTCAPRVVSAAAEDVTRVKVTFSEPVEAAGAEKAGNYTLDQGAAVTGVSLAADGKTAVLTTSKLVSDQTYALTVKEIRDRARQPNAMAGEATVKLAYSSGLVGQWKLDDGKGGTAQDSSRFGQHGALRNLDAAKCWVAGKAGGALELDGESGFVEIPNSPALQAAQEQDFTLTAWFKPSVLPPGAGNAYNAAFAIIAKKGFHEGLIYDKDGRFTFCHWLTGDKGAGATTQSTFAPGQFHHVTGVVDRAHGEVRLLVDGKLEARATFDPGAVTRAYGEESWRIGTANNNTHEGYGWPAKGVISDVRIYSRALSEEEVRNLAGADR